MANAPEVVKVDSREVSCDGGKHYGHPKVYLEIAPGETSVVCPYCSREFHLKT